MWYRDGTVQVTNGSNAVIGTGTKFIANTRVGDAFKGPDGAWYELVNVASDTAIAISPNYGGPTVTGLSYSVTPVQGYNKLLSDQVSLVISDTSDIVELAGASATAASASAASALSSKNSASASETNASNSAAAALSSKTAAKTSETNAAASAGAASTSETNAASSAAAALSSKNAAKASETNAAASAAAAAAGLDIQDNLTSTAANKPLSANQGNVLAKKVDGVELAAAVSWDTIINSGEYFVPGATGTNRPGLGGESFFVKVQRSSTRIKQTARAAGSSTTYSRWLIFSANVWSGWDRIISLSTVLSPVNTSGDSGIMESSANANGAYTKYIDGTMVCRVRIDAGLVQPGGAVGAGWTFPAAFADTPIPSGLGCTSGGSGYLVSIGGENPATATSFSVSFINRGTEARYAVVYLTATGRWR